MTVTSRETVGLTTPLSMRSFDYTEAFSRNIGLLTAEEQEKLRSFTIAIPGMGGVGGAHLISLVRQGFERFKIADIDTFELKNFNRQYGARLETIGKAKVAVMKEEALRINPHCQIEVYPQGVSEENMSEFLAGVHLSVDALDAFAVEMRRLFINESLRQNIPVISAGPIGFGTGFLVFKPDGPNFDDYFAITNKDAYEKKLISFFVGLVPKLLQLPYMKGTNLEEKRGPSSIGAIDLCAGVTAIYAIKLLLGKGNVRAVPYYHQYDVMRERYVSKRLWFGNRNPLQQLKIALAKQLTTD